MSSSRTMFCSRQKKAVLLSFTIFMAFSLTLIDLYPQRGSKIESIIENIEINNISQLIDLAQAKGIRAEVKVKALHRISHLFRRNKNKKNLPAIKTVKQLGKVARLNSQDRGSNFLYKVRQAVCSTLSMINSKEVSPFSIGEIQTLLLKEKNDRVRVSCFHALGNFRVAGDLASKVLLEQLKTIYKQGKISEISHESTIQLIVIIRSLGELASRSAFIPLMKILQSKYPISLKKEAEKAIEKISW